MYWAWNRRFSRMSIIASGILKTRLPARWWRRGEYHLHALWGNIRAYWRRRHRGERPTRANVAWLVCPLPQTARVHLQKDDISVKVGTCTCVCIYTYLHRTMSAVHPSIYASQSKQCRSFMQRTVTVTGSVDCSELSQAAEPRAAFASLLETLLWMSMMLLEAGGGRRRGR